MPPIDPAMMQQQGGPPPDAPPPDVPPEGADQPPQDMPAGGDPLSGEPQPASPEEQAQADKFVEKAWHLMYDDKTFPKIVEMLKGGADGGQGGDPVHGLAVTTDMVVARVAQLAGQAGENLMPDAVYHAAGDIFEDLMEISRVGKIKDYAQDENAKESAWFQALDLFRTRLAGVGEIDQQSANAGLEQLKGADQDGRLEKLMRGLAEGERSGQAGGPEPAPQQRGPRGLGTAMQGAA